MQEPSPLSVGHRAPDRVLEFEGGPLNLGAPGKRVLLYFYPKDDTPGCTAEACGLRDVWAEFQSRNTLVLGVSPDGAKSHSKFKEKFSLPFPLASDEDNSLAKAFGAWGKKQFMGRTYEGIHRFSFLISDDGKILKTYTRVKPAEHAREVLADIDSL